MQIKDLPIKISRKVFLIHNTPANYILQKKSFRNHFRAVKRPNALATSKFSNHKTEKFRENFLIAIGRVFRNSPKNFLSNLIEK